MANSQRQVGQPGPGLWRRQPSRKDDGERNLSGRVTVDKGKDAHVVDQKRNDIDISDIGMNKLSANVSATGKGKVHQHHYKNGTGRINVANKEDSFGIVPVDTSKTGVKDNPFATGKFVPKIAEGNGANKDVVAEDTVREPPKLKTIPAFAGGDIAKKVVDDDVVKHVFFSVQSETDPNNVFCPDDEAEVLKICSAFGEIRSLRKFAGARYKVNFYDATAAEKCSKELNNSQWKGIGQGIVKIEFPTQPKSSKPLFLKKGAVVFKPSGANNTPSRFSGLRLDSPGSGSKSAREQISKTPSVKAPVGPTCSVWVGYEYKGPGKPGEPMNVYTEGLTDEEIFILFSNFGTIHNTKHDPSNRFAFINFDKIESGIQAYDAYRSKKFLNKGTGRLKLKWGMPPSNHPLYNELIKLEEQRQKEKEASKLSATIPSTPTLTKTPSSQNLSANIDPIVAPNETLAESNLVETLVAKLSKPITVHIGPSGSNGNQPSSHAAPIQSDRPKGQAQMKIKHKADGFISIVSSLFVKCGSNTRDLVSELLKTKVDLRNNAMNFMDLISIGGILEPKGKLYTSPDSLLIPCVLRASSSTLQDGNEEGTSTVEDIADLVLQLRRRLPALAPLIPIGLQRAIDHSTYLQNDENLKLGVFIGILINAESGNPPSKSVTSSGLYDGSLLQQPKFIKNSVGFSLTIGVIVATRQSNHVHKFHDFQHMLRMIEATDKIKFLQQTLLKTNLSIGNVIDVDMENGAKDVALHLARSIRDFGYGDSSKHKARFLADAQIMLGPCFHSSLPILVIGSTVTFLQNNRKYDSLDEFANSVEISSSLLREIGSFAAEVRTGSACRLPLNVQICILNTIVSVCSRDPELPQLPLETQQVGHIVDIIFGAESINLRPIISGEKLLLFLQACYELEDEIFEEGTVVSWFKESMSSCKVSVAPVLTAYVEWLQEPDSDSDGTT